MMQGSSGTTAGVRPLLSICIPTYNRRERVSSLVGELLRGSMPIEVIVHDDGSSDGTFNALRREFGRDPRLKVSFDENQGRTGATLAAIRQGTGAFTMTVDDDDSLSQVGIACILEQCSRPLPSGVAGFIFHMAFEDGREITPFPCDRSNFLKLRADEGVTGDKKEVVETGLLKEVAFDPSGQFRRAPPSLSWARIALTHDVLCFNELVGTKRYLEGGITASIGRIKRVNAYPMVMLYVVHLRAFWKGRYRSYRYALKAAVAMTWYACLASRNRVWRIGDARTGTKQ